MLTRLVMRADDNQDPVPTQSKTMTCLALVVKDVILHANPCARQNFVGDYLIPVCCSVLSHFVEAICIVTVYVQTPQTRLRETLAKNIESTKKKKHVATHNATHINQVLQHRCAHAAALCYCQ